MLTEGITVVAVSDDLDSSERTLELDAIKCIGIHPWSVPQSSEGELKRIGNMAESADCLGEVGLDYRFVGSREKQRTFFEYFLDIAREYDLPLNLHALDAWRDVFDLLLRHDIRRAYFHWYNGPLDLIEEIVGQGYFIGINAAIKIQRKHLRVLERTPLSRLITESDGPYNYRGLRLSPSLIPELTVKVAEVKGVSVESVVSVVRSNLHAWLGSKWL
ncbi:MAG: TatD family hydrolase [Crenarchaeota archaeon]|nr:TatD family hydrolase [Thermoproteota archaeon]